MADETATAPPTAPPAPEETAPVTAEIAKATEASAEVNASATEASAEVDASATEAPAPPADKEAAPEKPAEATTGAEPEKAAEPSDTDMKDADAAPAADENADKTDVEAAPATATADSTATPSKSKDSSRRKSTGGGGKKSLKKKASMARITHLDAKPGDFFMIKTKGFSPWPGVVADKEMLPAAIIKTRPVTAQREDGSYREDFADGGKRAHERTYPVMYLETNEFAWIRNTDLQEIDFDTVADKIPSKANKALQAAHKLVAEKRPLSYFKEILFNHQEITLAEEQAAKEVEEARKAKAAAKEAAKAQATPVKKSHKKAKPTADGDEDEEMQDAADEEGSETTKKPTKKRKADESAETPQRTDSVKKPKIKFTTSSTPKTTNGAASTPKSTKPKDDSKPTKAKKKVSKETAETAEEPEEAAPMEPEFSAEEKHIRKKKEVLFLRHKLQRGLLTKDVGPKEEEMKTMSDFVTKLEAFPDLEVNIIRETKINKVLKAIIKLENIPKESDFKFKERSQTLLNQWNKLLDSEKPAGDDANGVNGSSAEPSKDTPEPGAKSKTNGVKAASEDASEAAKASDKKDSEEAAEKEKPAGEEAKDAPSTDAA